MLGAWLAATASAWTHRGEAWDDGPIRYCVAGDCPLADCEDAVHDAFDAWLGTLSCGAVWAEPVGTCAADQPVEDGVASVRFEVLEAADLSTYVATRDATIRVRELDYWRIVDFDLVIHPAHVDERMLLHQVGHVLGLTHSCEDPNADPSFTDPPCSGPPPPSVLGTAEGLTEDDVAGLRALYDPWVGLRCDPAPESAAITGFVPFDVGCELLGDVPDATTWAFGDGATGVLGEHTYEQAGAYVVTATAEGACGDATWTAEASVPVLALDPPAAGGRRDRGCSTTDPGGGGLLALVAAWRRRRPGVG